MQRLQIDLHNHTVASGHAFSTLNEIIEKAIQYNMIAIGISDHGPNMVGAPQESYFTMTKDIMQETKETVVLFGCEANILDINGNIDISEEIIKNLNYVIAGIHKLTTYEFNDKKNNTKAIVSCMEKNDIFAISHPINENFPIDIFTVVKAAKDMDVVMEINDRVLRSNNIEVLNKYLAFIECCGENNVKMILSSDSHTISTVGCFSSNKEIEKILDSGIYLYNNNPTELLSRMKNLII